MHWKTSYSRRSGLVLCGVSPAAALATLALGVGPAVAQNAPAGPAGGQADEAASGTPSSVQEVVVTGSRISSASGAQSPTPITVLGADDLAQQAPRDLSDVVNEVPSLAGSMTPQNRAIQVSNGTGGISAPALRGLGTNRTLVLLDGQRVVQSDDTGEVDVEEFPQQLVKRIDIVTGGASAVYGSDALAGVVNFVLDKDFTGVKGEVSAGTSDYSDDRNTKVDLSAGFTFAGKRGHVLLSGEYYRNEGILGNPEGTPERPWEYPIPGIIYNPAYTPTGGQPQYQVVPNIGENDYTKTGIITTGPLKGTAFSANGSPYRFINGVLSGQGGNFMSGGDTYDSNVQGMITLDPPMTRDNFFLRVSYDVTDDVNVYVQASRSHTTEENYSLPYINQGSLVIQADNAYLPPSVAAAANADGVTSFRVGDVFSPTGDEIDRVSYRYVIGADGTFQLFKNRWTWSAHASHGLTDSYQSVITNHYQQNYLNAIDAVLSPTTGAIACRSTLTNPNNGCIPYDVFGFGVASAAAQNYVFGTSYRNEYFSLDDVEADVTGSPFSDWAGPVSVALGAEYRNNSVSSDVDPGSAQSLWYGSNFFPLFGSLHVVEGSFEAEIPLAKDAPMAKSLDLNGGARATDYSTSGYVTTWKVGAVWAPIDDIRFRLTRSQDIRAPSLSELFSRGQTIGQSPYIDPVTNTQSPPATSDTIGNPNLKPEIGETLDIGFVLQPHNIPGFVASVDYYDINITDAIGTVAAQSEIYQCYAGVTTFCPTVVRGSVPGYGTPQITLVYQEPFNFASEHARGIDFEAAYSLPLDRFDSSWKGTITFRGLATHFIEDVQNNGITPPINLVGQNSYDVSTPSSGNEPNWKYLGSIAYETNKYTLAVIGRGVSAGVINTTYIQCSSGCPPSTVNNFTINDNHVAGAFYLDASFTYHLEVTGHPELFFVVDNLANRPPAYVPSMAGPRFPPTNPSLYDVVGRTFRAGVRFLFD